MFAWSFRKRVSWFVFKSTQIIGSVWKTYYTASQPISVRHFAYRPDRELSNIINIQYVFNSYYNTIIVFVNKKSNIITKTLTNIWYRFIFIKFTFLQYYTFFMQHQYASFPSDLFLNILYIVVRFEHRFCNENEKIC